MPPTPDEQLDQLRRSMCGDCGINPRPLPRVRLGVALAVGGVFVVVAGVLALALFI